MKLVKGLLTWLLALSVVHEVKPASGFGFIDTLEDIGEGAVGILEDGFEYVTDGSLLEDLSSIGNAIAGAAVAVGKGLQSLGIDVELLSDIWDAVYTVTGLEFVVEGFSSINWAKIGDEAKALMQTVGSEIVGFVNDAVDFITDFLDLSFLPFPLDVLRITDYVTIVDCYGDLIFEATLEFAKSVAQNYAEMATLGDAAPLFNDRGLESEIEDTRVCMGALAQDLHDRQESSDSPLQSGIDAALSWFDMDDFTIGLEISFTACVAVCGTAAIGFAYSLFGVQLAIYLALGMSIELSPSVGASIEMAMNFWPTFDSVPGEVFVVSMSSEIPLLPSGIAMAVGLNGAFGGFSISSTLLSTPSGVDDVFSIGAGLVHTTLLATVTSIDEDYDENITNGTAGGFFKRGRYYAWGSDNAEDYCDDGKTINVDGVDYHCGKNFYIDLSCPGTDFTDPNIRPGNMSSVTLPYLWIDEVMHGTTNNISGAEYHNTSTGYNYLYSRCSMEPSCSVKIQNDMFLDDHDNQYLNNGRLVGPDKCNLVSVDEDEQCLINIDVLFSCPPADYSSVFNAGCYDISVFELYLELFYSGSNLILESNPNDEFWWLDDDFNTRTNSIAKCSAAARALGEEVFGFHNQQCFAGPGLFDIYQNYTSVECPGDGLGDFSTLQVWVFQDAVISWQDEGCRNLSYLQQHNAILVDMEDHHILTQDVYQDRLSAVSKCAQMAKQYNLTSFALLDGGQCYIMCVDEEFATDQNASYECTNNGKGTGETFNVYKFKTANTTQCTIPSTLEVCTLGFNGAVTSDRGALSDGAIIAIAVGSFVLVVFVSAALVGCWWRKRMFGFEDASTKLGVEVKDVVPGQGFKVGGHVPAPSMSVSRDISQTGTIATSGMEGTFATSDNVTPQQGMQQTQPTHLTVDMKRMWEATKVKQVKAPPRVGSIAGSGSIAEAATGPKPSWMN